MGRGWPARRRQSGARVCADATIQLYSTCKPLTACYNNAAVFCKPQMLPLIPELPPMGANLSLRAREKRGRATLRHGWPAQRQQSSARVCADATRTMQARRLVLLALGRGLEWPFPQIPRSRICPFQIADCSLFSHAIAQLHSTRWFARAHIRVGEWALVQALIRRCAPRANPAAGQERPPVE